MIYLDSSVALAWLLTEPRHAPETIWREPVVASRLLEYEVWNRIHARLLTRTHAERTLTLLNKVEFFELSETVLARALKPFPVAVSTLDGLHLATIEHIRTSGRPISLASFDKLNPWYYSDAPKSMRPVLDIVRRQSTFDEVVKGLDESNALYEARRCLSCGNCFECDNCYGVCPDNAVIKLGPGQRFQFNYDYCKGCGVCAAECPCGAIDMLQET